MGTRGRSRFHARDDRADYLVVAGMSKNDLAMKLGDAPLVLEHRAPLHPAGDSGCACP
jgi:hypothetical protein